MAESEPLLQPEMLAELKRYRALENRIQISREQCQEFKELSKQVAPRNTPPLTVPLSDGSPAAELDEALSALREQIETIHRIGAQLNEQQSALHRPTYSREASLPSQPQLPLSGTNMKVAIYIISAIILLIIIISIVHSI